MPRKSKRVAARQAALSKKKKTSRTSVYRASEGPPKTPPAGQTAAPRPAAAPASAEDLPEFSAPQAEAPASVPQLAARAVPAPDRRAAALRMPYLRSDLTLTVKAGTVLVAALIVLAFVL